MTQSAHKLAPALPPSLARELLKQALDFVLVLDDADRIAHVMLSPDASEHPLGRAVGQPLENLLSVESQAKLATLLSSNSMEEDSAYRWRHVNMLVSPAQSLAVLVKYVEVAGPDQVWRALLCRDLTPIGRMQKRLMQAHGELEDSLKRVRADASATERTWRHEVGVAPLATIRERWIERIEQDCVREALGRCHGDERAAALLLGVSVDYIRRHTPGDSSPPLKH